MRAPAASDGPHVGVAPADDPRPSSCRRGPACEQGRAAPDAVFSSPPPPRAPCARPDRTARLQDDPRVRMRRLVSRRAIRAEHHRPNQRGARPARWIEHARDRHAEFDRVREVEGALSPENVTLLEEDLALPDRGGRIFPRPPRPSEASSSSPAVHVCGSCRALQGLSVHPLLPEELDLRVGHRPRSSRAPAPAPVRSHPPQALTRQSGRRTTGKSSCRRPAREAALARAALVPADYRPNQDEAPRPER